MKYRYYFYAILFFLSAATTAAQVSVQLQVELPSTTVAQDSIFVAGSWNNWQPGSIAFRLQRTAPFRAAITVRLQPGTYEYKFTRGTWQKGETLANGAFRANRRLIVTKDTIVEHQVISWEDLHQNSNPSTKAENVRIDSIRMPQGSMRRYWVYLPPDYATSGKNYPVLYMMDGQNVFDNVTAFSGEWGIDETLNSLAAKGENVPIVVAIDNGGGERLNEYSPWRNPQYGGGKGEEFLKFLVEQLKTNIDTTLRTSPGRLSTGIGGSSMGGLISVVAAVEYPEVFSRIAVFSPALWFSRDSLWSFIAEAKEFNDFQRIYVVAGERESSSMMPDIFTADSLLRLRNNSLETAIVGEPNGQHNEAFWRAEFADAYKYLFSDVPTSINEEHPDGKSMLSPSLSPIPSRDKLFISRLQTGDNIILLSVHGEIIKQETASSEIMAIDTTAVKSGMYIVMVYRGNKVFRQQTIIVR